MLACDLQDHIRPVLGNLDGSMNDYGNVIISIASSPHYAIFLDKTIKTEINRPHIHHSLFFLEETAILNHLNI